MTVRRNLVIALLVLAAAGRLCAGPSPSAGPSPASTDTVRIGILHSLTGPMAVSERSLVDAALLAVEEVNAKGGVLGKQLEAYILDGGSDPSAYGQLAEQLIVEDRVVSVFGCWTSASRKAVIPVVEKHGNLLWYPACYEGREKSPRVIYGGMVPNQQLIPALDWCFRRFGKRLFLIATDDAHARVANGVVRWYVEKAGGSIIDEVYLPPGHRELRALAQQVRDTDPDAVFNALRGATNAAFFSELAYAGIGPHQVPVISLSMAEEELSAMEPDLAAEHFAVWSYFQSLDTPENKRFVNAFKRRYGLERVTADPMEAIYTQVHLFAQAAAKAGSADPEAVRKAVLGMEIEGPSGKIRIDPETQHAYKTARIGQITRAGQLRLLWSSPEPIKPEPFAGP